MHMLRVIARIALFSSCAVGIAQQEPQPTIGSVATRDALVTGGLEVQDEHAQLLTSASVTAYGHTAPIVLTRGGDVLVCSTSRFHIMRSGKGSTLTFALDRGAVEIHSDSQAGDVVMTPDLRMTFVTSGPLDLRVRVTPNGDTCVENTGKSAPQISIGDAFSDSSYRLRPGQHVLFEHGSVREVVDLELSPCGCPAESAPTMNLAQAGSDVSADAATRNPFPEAVSQGLAPEAKPVTKSVARQTGSNAQVTAALTYSETPGPAAAPVPAPTPAAPVQTAALAPPASPPGAHDIVHAIGRFFRRLFHGKEQDQRD